MKLAPLLLCAVDRVGRGRDLRPATGSCRLEVSTTTVKTKGDTAAVASRSSRRVKRTRKLTAKGVRLAAVRLAAPTVSVPLPRPSPRRVAAASGTKPTTVVNEAFNSLASSGSTDRALEAALISRRDQFLGFALR